MKTEFDVVAVATRLVDEWGEDAPRVSKVRLVELIAANNQRAAAFWREVMRMCESILAAHTAPPPQDETKPPAAA